MTGGDQSLPTQSESELLAQVEQLVACEDEVALENLADLDGLPAEVLLSIARYVMPLEYGGVLSRIAQNRNTSHELLRELAQQESLHWHVTENSNAPEDVLKSLASSEDPEVRFNVSDNPALTAPSLSELALDERPEVREVAAMHTSTPLQMLELLAVDVDAGVRKAVSKNPSASEIIRAAAVLQSFT
jgi:hypothetical protein